MSDLVGRVALVTGTARGLGRAACVRLAEEGVDIVGVDIGRQIVTVDYPMPDADTLEETRSLVEAQGSRMLVVQADVRDATSIREAVDSVSPRVRASRHRPGQCRHCPLRGPEGQKRRPGTTSST